MTAQFHSTTATVNFDDAGFSGLLNGEQFTINGGGTLILNSDPQWAQNSAYLGAVAAQFGVFRIDARSTRWLQVNTPTGTVPAVGVTLTGATSGATGEIIGVWSTFPSKSPATSGAAFGSTCWIKLRSASATYQSGETVSGGTMVGGTAASSDSIGWLLAVATGTVSSSGGAEISTLGRGTIEVLGDWFYLGVGNGTANQTFNHYTPDLTPFVEVETGSGTNVFEQFWCRGPLLMKEIVHPDEPCFFMPQNSAVMTFDRKVITSGARVRVPNIHITSTTAALWATQDRFYPNGQSGGGAQSPFFTSPRAQIIVAGNGNATIDKCVFGGARLAIGNSNSITIRDSGVFGRSFVGTSSKLVMDGFVGAPNDGSVAGAFEISTITGSTSLNRLLMVAATGMNSNSANPTDAQMYVSGNGAQNTATSTGAGCLLDFLSNGSITNSRFIRALGHIRGTANSAFALQGAVNLTLDNVEFAGGSATFLANQNLTVKNIRGSLHASGPNLFAFNYTTGTGTQPVAGTTFTSSGGATGVLYGFASTATAGDFGGYTTSGTLGAGNETITFSNGYTCLKTTSSLVGISMLWFGLGHSNVDIDGVYRATKVPPMTHTGRALVDINSPTNKLTVANIGTEATPFDFLDRSLLRAVYVTTGSKAITVRRCYLTGGLGNTSWVQILRGVEGVLVENVYAAVNQQAALTGVDNISRGNRLSAAVLSSSGTALGFPGVAESSSWMEGFASDTVGTITFCPTPNSTTRNECTYSGTYDFGSPHTFLFAGSIVESEMSYFAKGHTGFTSTYTFAFSTVIEVIYRIDTGTGFGAWKTLNDANLLAETISPTIGFRLSIRFNNNTAGYVQASGVFIQTTTTLTNQLAAIYPLPGIPLTLTGLVIGSEVRVYLGTDPASVTDIDGTESSGTTFSTTHTSAGQEGIIVVFATGYQTIRLPITFSAGAVSIPVQQTVDRVFENA
jgi:hypothetical protein